MAPASAQVGGYGLHDVGTQYRRWLRVYDGTVETVSCCNSVELTIQVVCFRLGCCMQAVSQTLTLIPQTGCLHCKKLLQFRVVKSQCRPVFVINSLRPPRPGH